MREYQDPEFKNLTKVKIGEELWIVNGVWYVSDGFDSNGNAIRPKTEFIGLQAVPPTKAPDKKITKDDLKRAIRNGHFK